ncbi:tyrosine-type recombinase/integrase [Rhizobium leguminosarum]|uniref:tyrosine-type recombinase/integrase n=1 Tax=Rhizobium leguminosarum TaxID=384 RepID=UPI001441C7EB|nr:recombinase XerD [Rhizobium leguminosarum]NKL60075.1 tyrosine-type recombinase/integrase [Rhizobium leguminosarum bv. viciae]
MAYFTWVPQETRIKNLRDITDIPVLFDDNHTYLDEVNLYVQLRCRGRIELNQVSVGQIGIKRKGAKSILAICYRLTNFFSWLETETAHPMQGVMTLGDVEPWHINLMYREAMVGGFWTQEFWATGNQEPLNMATTIKMRIHEANTCMDFLYGEGLVPWKSITEPDLPSQQRSVAAAKDAYLNTIPHLLRIVPPPLKYNRRKDPSDWSPLTPVELRAIYRCIASTSIRFAMLLFLTTGLRLAEVVDNALVHGELMNLRAPGERHHRPKRDGHQYQLRYDLRDDKMIGVLPSPEMVFKPDAPLFIYYRIKGKGTKIRSIPVLTVLLRHMWRWFVSGRTDLLAAHSVESSPYFLLNERGSHLNEWNISYGLRKAKKTAEEDLATSIHLTPHVLRHTFARVFLEANILSAAENAGLDPKKLTLDQIEEFALGPLLSLKDLLGHALLKDTMTYLRQFVATWVGFQYLKVFAQALGETMDDLA